MKKYLDRFDNKLPETMPDSVKNAIDKILKKESLGNSNGNEKANLNSTIILLQSKIKHANETIDRLKNCENCDHSGKPYYDRYGAPHCDKGTNVCLRWNDTDGLPDLWEERND